MLCILHIERRLASLVGGAARPGTERQQNNGQPRAGPPMGAPRVARLPLIAGVAKLHESSNITSLVLELADGEPPLTAALAGDFIVLRLRPRPDESPLLRSYSLSDAPSAVRYRISVKREPDGAAGAYIDMRVQAGEILRRAPRAATLRCGRARVPWSLSAPASARPQYSLCCTHWPPSKLGEKFGGFTVPATAASIHLRRRCGDSSRPYPEAAATFVTVRQSRPIGRLSISIGWGAWACPCLR